MPKRSSRHPHDPPGPAGHSISCPCHQLCWVQMGGARPPAEEGQRRVVGDHHKVRRAAHGGGAAVSTGLDRPTRRRRAIGAGCMCAWQEFVCAWRCTICDPKDQCVGCPQGGVPQIEIQEPQNRSDKSRRTGVQVAPAGCGLVAVRPPGAGTDRARLLTLRPPRAAKGTPKGLGCSLGVPREQPNVYP